MLWNVIVTGILQTWANDRAQSEVRAVLDANVSAAKWPAEEMPVSLIGKFEYLRNGPKPDPSNLPIRIPPLWIMSEDLGSRNNAGPFSAWVYSFLSREWTKDLINE